MAKFGNLPEVVIFTEFGVEHKALVVGSRTLEHHTGENDEPLLTVVIVKPVVADECVNCHFPERNHGKPFPPGSSHRPCANFEGVDPVAPVNPAEYVHIKSDVAHESHKFSDEQLAALQKQGLTTYPGGSYPGGRWREIAEPVAAVPAAEPAQVEPPAQSTPPVVQ